MHRDKTYAASSNNHVEVDISGLVAMSMALEEMITASLLPLAGYHVMRCRRIEEQNQAKDDEEEDENYVQYEKGDPTVPYSTPLQNTRIHCHPITQQPIEINGELNNSNNNNNNTTEKENPWDEWTLPPEESILKLLEQGLIQVPQRPSSLLSSENSSSSSMPDDTATTTTSDLTDATATAGGEDGGNGGASRSTSSASSKKRHSGLPLHTTHHGMDNKNKNNEIPISSTKTTMMMTNRIQETNNKDDHPFVFGIDPSIVQANPEIFEVFH